MKKKENNLFYYLLIAFLAVFASLGFVSFVLINSQAADEDISNTSTTISNSDPSVDSVTYSSPVTLLAGINTQVTVSGFVSDPNGCNDITDIRGSFYRTDLNCGGGYDNNNCYEIETLDCSVDLDADGCTGGSGTIDDFDCTFDVAYYADATDATGKAPATTWTAFIEVSDDGATFPNNNSTTGEVNSTIALDLNSANIDYGSLAVGADSGASPEELVIYNFGNTDIDVQVTGGDANVTDDGTMVCTLGSVDIPVGNQEFNSATFTYGAGTDLTSAFQTALTAGTDIDNRTDDTGTSYTTSDGFGSVFFGIAVPTGAGGTCSGFNTLKAIAGLP